MSNFLVEGVVFDPILAKFIILALLLCLASYSLYRFLLPRPIPDIPYNPASSKSLWGDVPDLLSHPVGLNLWTGEHLAKLQTPICQVLMGPFSKPVVLVADFGDARNMLMSTNDFDRSDYIIDRFPLLGGFHFRRKTGAEWRHGRQILQDLMAPRFLNEVVGPLVYQSTEQLIQVWTKKISMAPDTPFCVVKDLQDVSIDVMVSSLFGGEFKDLAMDRHVQHYAGSPKVTIGGNGEAIFPRITVHKFLEDLAVLANIITGLYVPEVWSPKLISWWLKNVSHRSAFATRDITIRSAIQNSVNRLGTEPQSGIDYMIGREEKAALKAGRPPAFDGQDMVDEIYGESVAGEHTTAAALTWVVKFVTDHPQAQATLRNALHSTYANAVQEKRLPTVDEMVSARIPYLEAVLEESFRLRAAFLVPRDTVRDTTLLGHRIPKGTTVLLVAQAPDFSSVPIAGDSERYRHFKSMGTADERYRDMHAFKPERWLSTNEAGQLDFDGVFRPQLAFGLGPRGCWGRKLVYLEMRMALTMILWKFDLLQTPESLSSHEGTYDITFRARQAYLKLRPRDIGE